MSPPRVSILLPAWNAADCIGLALESIRRQTERAWECVVLDDGSEDGTAIVRRFATVDARVRVLTRPHRGLIRTRQPHRPTLYDRPVHACKAHYLATGFLSAVGRFVLWGYGSTGRLLCAALLAHGKHPYAIVEVQAGRIGQRIHGAPVIAIADLPSLRRERIVVSVARAGPRAEIRAALASMDFVEGRDFVCAAQCSGR